MSGKKEQGPPKIPNIQWQTQVSGDPIRKMDQLHL